MNILVFIISIAILNAVFFALEERDTSLKDKFRKKTDSKSEIEINGRSFTIDNAAWNHKGEKQKEVSSGNSEPGKVTQHNSGESGKISRTTSDACSDNLTWTLDGGTLTIRGKGKMENYAVQKNAPWYGQRESIQTVVIESGVTSIGEYAFNGCSNLTAVTMPDSVTSILNKAFSGCSKLRNVYYSGTEEERDSKMKVGNNFELAIAVWHFSGESNGKNLTWTLDGGTLTIYGKGNMEDYNPWKYAPWFEHRESIQAVVIKSGVTSVGNFAFMFCTNLTAVTIPDSVMFISYGAFSGCVALQEFSVDERNAKYIAEDGILFTKDRSILFHYPAGKKETHYTLPEGVTSIANCAFDRCRNLTAITILNGVTAIGEMAVPMCDSLTSITIPNSVTSIENMAFFQCNKLKDVYYDGTEADRTGKLKIEGSNSELTNATWHYRGRS